MVAIANGREPSLPDRRVREVAAGPPTRSGSLSVRNFGIDSIAANQGMIGLGQELLDVQLAQARDVRYPIWPRYR